MNESRESNYHMRGPSVGSRLSVSPAPEMVQYSYGLRIEEGKYSFHYELWNHKAHTIMLYEEGIITKEDASKILGVLEEIDRMGSDEFPMDPSKGDLFYNVESYLTEKIGEDAAGKMHMGRSRADMNACFERMVIREKMLQVIGDVLMLMETLLNISEKNRETIMPAYTLLQHARPTTFAHYLLSFVDRFRRDVDRLRETYRRVNMSPMGSAVITGSSFPLNRARVAELLGFNGVVENTRDASTSRDSTLESIAHLAILMSNLSTLADDLNVWCTYEFGMVELHDAYCGTSSIMPQKKNPSSLERIRHICAECIGNTMTVFTQLKTPSEQLVDFEATGPVIWRTFDRAHAMVRLMNGILSTLKVNKDLMYRRAAANFTQATQLAETIVREKNLAFRTAHRIVGKLVRNCIGEGIPPSEVSPEMVDRAAVEVLGSALEMDTETLRKSLDVEIPVLENSTVGGPGRKEVNRMLGTHSSRIMEDKRWLKDHQGSLASSRDSTNSIATDLAGATS